MNYFTLFALILAAAIIIRIVLDRLDRERIAQYIEGRGGRIVEIHWTPFGPGWFGEKSDRIYGVIYFDQDEKKHRASCKTGMWTGVYFTEDTVTAQAPSRQAHLDSTALTLEEENRRLREEIERLKRELR